MVGVRDYAWLKTDSIRVSGPGKEGGCLAATTLTGEVKAAGADNSSGSHTSRRMLLQGSQSPGRCYNLLMPTHDLRTKRASTIKNETQSNADQTTD